MKDTKVLGIDDDYLYTQQLFLQIKEDREELPSVEETLKEMGKSDEFIERAISEHAMIYHYSPKTKKAEVCTSPDRCPYRNTEYDCHSYFEEDVQLFADRINHPDRTVNNINQFTSIDWAVSTKRPYVLSNKYKLSPESVVKISDLEDCKVINGYIADKFRNKTFFLLPKTREAIQVFLEDIEEADKMIEYVNEKIEWSPLKNVSKSTYDKRRFIQLVKYARDPDRNILNKDILKTPRKNTSRDTEVKLGNIMEVWQDFRILKEEEGKLFEITFNNQNFYIFTNEEMH